MASDRPRTASPGAAAAPDDHPVELDDEVGAILDQLLVDSHDRVARSDLRVIEEPSLEIVDRSVDQWHEHSDVVLRGKPAGELQFALPEGNPIGHHLRERFEALAGPARERLKVELPEARRDLADLQGQRNAYLRFQHEHPEALRRLDRLDEQIASAAWELDVERQGLDGIRPERPRSTAQRWAAERGLGGMDRGLGLGIDL